MFEIILYHPEIPPNTGNIIRLCANTGCHLHLIRPYGFILDNKRLKRAGLDYHELTSLTEHNDLESCLDSISPSRIFAFTTKGTKSAHQCQFKAKDALLFGPETKGLPQEVLATFNEDHRLVIPQLPSSRSLNLSNAVAIAVYEAWRQLGFAHPSLNP